MGTFSDYDSDTSDLSLEDGKALFLRTGGRLHYHSYGYSRNGEITNGKHWGSRWVGTRGMGNCGTLVMLPLSKEARAFTRHHTAIRWHQEFGVSYKEACLIYDAPFRYKHEQIDEICKALLDETTRKPFLSFPPVAPNSHLNWLAAWRPLVEEYMVGSWLRIEKKIAIVNYVRSKI